MKAITAGQKKQYKRFVEDAAERALAEVGLDKDAIQRLIEKGDEFQSRIVTAIREPSVSNQYADEEVESSYDYAGYQPKPIAEQVKVLRELFPELGSVDESLAKADLPPNTEGWFAIPRWDKIASTYGKALEKVLGLISEACNGELCDYLDSQYLRQHETVAMLKHLGYAQSKHDILVVPAQFGLRHRGRSIRRARKAFNASEFGLGPFQIAVMILTHPERLQHYDDPWIDCAGDEYTTSAVGSFSHAPLLYFRYGLVLFNAYWVDFANTDYDSVSAFLPQ